MRRLRRMRASASGDDGSALALALTFLLVVSLVIGVVLQFATSGQRITGSVRDEATSTYAGGGALDGAINSLRSTPSRGTVSSGTTTCFTVPPNELANPAAVPVTCTPRPGSGALAPGALASQPEHAVLTRSDNAAEGVVLEVGANVPVQGDVAARKLVSVPAGSTFSSTESVTAGGSCVGTTVPACVVSAGPADPGWPGPSTASTPFMGALPACTPLITLTPGIYRSAAALRDVLNCTSAVVWFQPGTYFFDFTDAAPHELVIDGGDVVVGGTPSGWTPGPASTAVNPPYPTSAAPGASACDIAQPGVDLVFGGDSRLTVQQGGRAQFCALSTSTTAQHIVLRSLTSSTTVAATAGSPTTTSSDMNVPGARTWTNPTGGAVAGGLAAYVKLPNALDPPSKLLVGPVSSTLVPADATGITVTTTVRESLTGTGNSKLAVRPGNGDPTLAPVLLRDCPASPCAGSATGPWYLDAVTTTGLTPAQANGMSFEVVISNPNNSPIEAWIDGVTVTVTFSLPVAAAGGTVTNASAYTPTSTTTTPLLKAAGATTVLALHGTVYAPAAILDLGLTSVPYTVIDRGLVARHLQLSMTRAAASGPPLISIPPLVRLPRRVVLTTNNGARADVTFANATGAAGTRNGSIPTVLEWSVG